MKELQQMDLYTILNAMLDYQQQVLLDEWLPKRYKVPSGSQIRLNYAQPGNPVLSVRLQEMLGCAENPSVARGQILLKVELLSPARRPVQVTTDLANFWTNSYPAVKKDMAGRYPRHVWPDNPLEARPTAYAKRRRR
jgi:ATP-dependent helicase HrpB